jgi:hypothetical protein
MDGQLTEAFTGTCDGIAGYETYFIPKIKNGAVFAQSRVDKDIVPQIING